jgi:hypothetical protein
MTRSTVLQSLPLMIAFFCTACGGAEQPIVIDGSTKQSFDRTLAEAKSDLKPTERVKFEVALGEFKARMFAGADNKEDYDRRVRDGLNGLTAPAIVAKFDENAQKLRDDATDAVFDAKRAVAKGSAPE